jgi:hypothetical protein
MDGKSSLVVWNTPKHVVPFIWNKMLKFRISRKIFNHDVWSKIILIQYSSFKAYIMYDLIGH